MPERHWNRKTHGVSCPHEGPLHNYTSNKHSQSTSEKARSAKEVRVPASWNWPKWKVALFGIVAPWIQLVNGRGHSGKIKVSLPQMLVKTRSCWPKRFALVEQKAESRMQMKHNQTTDSEFRHIEKRHQLSWLLMAGEDLTRLDMQPATVFGSLKQWSSVLVECLLHSGPNFLCKSSIL